MSSVIKPCAAAEEKGSPAAATFKSSGTPQYIKIIYIALNVFAACSIVFANKIVFAVYHFKFVTTLTLIHTLFTWLGMIMMQQLGFFDSKSFTPLEIAPLALGYVGYIVLNNLSLNLNTVGFYQILKIAITPTVIFLEFLLFRKVQSLRVLLAVVVVCVGVAAAAVTDTVAVSNLVGVAVGLGSVVVTALYQIWAGSKQRELRANSSQLLLAYTPQATVLLAVLAPLLDDIGFAHPGPNTVLGYSYRPAAVAAIVVSGLLGLLVSLSTFLVIGATSSLTYNVVGHSKTVLILAGGCLIFGDSMPWKRLLGIAVTMSGIAWYTYLTMQPAASSRAQLLLTDSNNNNNSSSKNSSSSGSGSRAGSRAASAGGASAQPQGMLGGGGGGGCGDGKERERDLEKEPLLLLPAAGGATVVAATALKR